MPFGEIKLVPGVNVERTPTLLQASISSGNLIRFKDGLVQKLGGWQSYYPFSVPGMPRDLHAWEDLDQVTHLGVGTTTALGVITNNNYQDITPQTLTTNFPPNFTTTSGSPIVTVTDTNINNVTIYDAVYFNTPVSVDGIILSGLYAISEVTGADSYDIVAATNGVSGVTSQGTVPAFTTTSGSALVAVELASHGLVAGSTINFPIGTTGNGVTVLGTYPVVTLIDANNFKIGASNQASASGSFNVNAANTQLVYYISLGPPALGAGYGLGGYGAGGYGTGTTSGNTQTGTEITATDWTSDNWGEILLAVPAGGGVYAFDPTSGFVNAQLVATAPIFNGGGFVSASLQILVLWGSTVAEDIGVTQDPLFIQWSNEGDYTDFVDLTTNLAGNDRLSSGSKIMGGLAVQQQNLIWTDIDLWAMNYIGAPLVFSFNIIGAGAGLISSHAAQAVRGNVYWMGPSNFYAYTSNGVAVLPCPVWDAVFQNLNTAYQQNVRAMPNTPFNEVGWLYPSAASVSGECDSYVKFNITESGAPWDNGVWPLAGRSAWIDQTILGPPIGATPGGVIYQHERTPDAAGAAMVSTFTTGYFYIGEGEDFCFVDQIYPDFIWETYAGTYIAQGSMSFNVTNYPGDTPTVYGPYTVTKSTEYLSVRLRGRQMSITVTFQDVGSFYRLGKVRYRYNPDGRR
jgi:hypothetical protein